MKYKIFIDNKSNNHIIKNLYEECYRIAVAIYMQQLNSEFKNKHNEFYLLTLQDNAFAFSLPKLIISRALVPPTLGTTPFQIANYRGTLKVPQEAMDAYRTNWMINQVGYLGWSTARWGLVALAEGE